MVLFKLLVFTITFYDLIVDLDAGKSCPKGHQITRDGGGCEICPNDYYQPEVNYSKYCKPCTKCDEKTSVVKETCTKETNTKCQCLRGFVPRYPDSSACKCDSGFGLKPGRECSECEDGYFNPHINSPCQKWKECKCGVNRNGTKTTDVICKAELEGCSDASNTYVTPPPTSKKIFSRIPPSTPHHIQEGATTTTTTTTTTTAAPGHRVTKGQTLHTPETGTAIVILVIVGLLVVLTAVTCKLHITRQPAAPRDDSLCRRPVEESGDDSLSSLKLNPGGY